MNKDLDEWKNSRKKICENGNLEILKNKPLDEKGFRLIEI
jgi:hypothetical protein